MTENGITKQLEEAKGQLARAQNQITNWQRQADIAQARVEAFEISAKYLAEMEASVKSPIQKITRKRMPSSHWVRIFRELYDRYNSGFGYDQIMGVATSLEIGVKRASLRAKMMILTDNGRVKRISDGKFIITLTGAEHFGLLTSNDEREAKIKTDTYLGVRAPSAMPPDENGASAEAPEAEAGGVSGASGFLTLNLIQDQRGIPNVDPNFIENADQ